MDSHIELDVIAICCEYTEYESIEQAAEEYELEADEIQDHTTILTFDRLNVRLKRTSAR